MKKRKGAPASSTFIDGNALKEAISEKGLTQKELAVKIDITEKTLSKSLNENWMSWNVLNRIAKELKLNPELFIDGNDSNKAYMPQSYEEFLDEKMIERRMLLDVSPAFKIILYKAGYSAELIESIPDIDFSTDFYIVIKPQLDIMMKKYALAYQLPKTLQTHGFTKKQIKTITDVMKGELHEEE